MRTALTVYPYGLRFMNFVSVSDSPIGVDRERWRQVLGELELDGGRVFDPSRQTHLARLEEVLAMADGMDSGGGAGVLESRESVLARTAGYPVITDDNMATEWQKVGPYALRVLGLSQLVGQVAGGRGN